MYIHIILSLECITTKIKKNQVDSLVAESNTQVFIMTITFGNLFDYYSNLSECLHCQR